MSTSIAIESKPIKRVGAFEKRIHEVDFIRGALMLLVIIDHIFLRFAMNGKAWFEYTDIEFFKHFYLFFSFYWNSIARSIIRPMVLFGFTFISGISCAFSKDNWKRAGLMLLVYFGVMIVTNIMDATLGPGNRIDFNVIGVLAVSTLVYCFFQKFSWKSLSSVVLISCLITIFVIPILLTIPKMTDAFVPFLWSPQSIRVSWNPDTLSFVYHSYPDAFETMGIRIGDHMPLFPYMGFFFMGALVSSFIYVKKQSIFKHRYEFERPICFVGRHALWFYLGHQVIIFPIFWLLDLIIMH